MRYSPADVERICGVNTDALRNWRRLTLADGIGERNSAGRWTYDYHDLVVIAATKVLARNGLHLEGAVTVAQRYAEQISLWQTDPVGLENSNVQRFLEVELDLKLDSEGLASEATAKIRELHNPTGPRGNSNARLIDLALVAADCPSELLKLPLLEAITGFLEPGSLPPTYFATSIAIPMMIAAQLKRFGLSTEEIFRLGDNPNYRLFPFNGEKYADWRAINDTFAGDAFIVIFDAHRGPDGISETFGGQPVRELRITVVERACASAWLASEDFEGVCAVMSLSETIRKVDDLKRS